MNVGSTRSLTRSEQFLSSPNEPKLWNGTQWSMVGTPSTGWMLAECWPVVRWWRCASTRGSCGPKPARRDLADRSQCAAIPPTEANPRRFRRPKPIRSDSADRSQCAAISPTEANSTVLTLTQALPRSLATRWCGIAVQMSLPKDRDFGIRNSPLGSRKHARTDHESALLDEGRWRRRRDCQAIVTILDVSPLLGRCERGYHGVVQRAYRA